MTIFVPNSLPASSLEREPVRVEPASTPALVLPELLARANPRQRDDDAIRHTMEFERTVTSSLPPMSAYSENWQRLYRPDIREESCAKGFQEIEARVRGHLLIDLGGGSPLEGKVSRMQWLAERFGASAFISVDRYAIDMGADTYAADPRVDLSGHFGIPQPPAMPVALCKASMLDFLGRLPDGCCNAVMNGIDGFVLHYRDYEGRMLEELNRVIRPDGVVFGIKAEPLNRLAQYGFQVLNPLMPVSDQISLLVKPG